MTGYLGRSLSSVEKERLGTALYGAILGGRPEPGELFDWEREWYAAELPPPPARVLVGGAGAGREVRALVAMGYVVDALEPAPSAAELCRSHLGPGGDVVVGSYRDLVAGTTRLSSRKYDAVLLGWGSLSHVLSTEGQRALLRAAAALTPKGPILASFWMHHGESADLSRRAYSWGRRLGELTAQARGLTPGPSQDKLTFSSWAGFSAPLSAEDLQMLADTVGRLLRSDTAAGDYPRATFLAV